MKTSAYQNKAGRMLYCPVIETEHEMFMINGTDDGFCLGCGGIQGGVEPDARRYECESCGEKLVFGFQELLIMDILKFEEEKE